MITLAVSCSGEAKCISNRRFPCLTRLKCPPEDRSCEIQSVQCIALGEILTTDVIAFILVHFICSREEGVVGSDVITGRIGKVRFEQSIRNLISI